MNTTLKKQIILDLDILEENGMLHLVSQFMELMKQKKTISTNEILKRFAGTMAKEDAEEMEIIINREFNTIEGEW